MPDQRADPDVAVLALDFVQPWQPADVEHQLRLGESQLHKWDQALAAGHHLDVITALGQETERFV
jgi:hypothetical protein